ncbi:unnamed protein product [Plutella xylostella]|uniref:(diamondback moth) hypothetical protein n=1 Tax=Plutella xylostella TaxID=51655 RepID=A0A8S4F6B6_PLUXY|nr:unnamed protein product [Plutella xylostella]
MAPKRGRARRCNLDDDDDRSRTGETTVMTRSGAPPAPEARAPAASPAVRDPPATPGAPHEHAARGPPAARATPAAAAATPDAPACVTAAQLSVLLDTIAKATETNRVLLERMSSDPRTCTPPARRGPGAASPPARATASDYLTPPPGTFAKCTARFDGAGRSADQLDVFIDAVQVYKECANVSDEHALRGLPMLLEGDAAVWWRGVRASVAGWGAALQRLRAMYGTPLPAYKVFRAIFSSEQNEVRSDVYISRVRALLAQLPYELLEDTKLDIIYGLLSRHIRKRIPREGATSVDELIFKCRAVEEASREVRNSSNPSNNTRQNVYPSAATHNCLNPPSAVPFSNNFNPLTDRPTYLPVHNIPTPSSYSGPNGATRVRPRCAYCRRLGHHVDYCRTKKRESVESTPGNPPLSPRGHAVNSGGEHEFLTAEIQGKYDPRPLVNIKVGGALGAAVLDTASLRIPRPARSLFTPAHTRSRHRPAEPAQIGANATFGTFMNRRMKLVINAILPKPNVDVHTLYIDGDMGDQDMPVKSLDARYSTDVTRILTGLQGKVLIMPDSFNGNASIIWTSDSHVVSIDNRLQYAWDGNNSHYVDYGLCTPHDSFALNGNFIRDRVHDYQVVKGRMHHPNNTQIGEIDLRYGGIKHTDGHFNVTTPFKRLPWLKSVFDINNNDDNSKNKIFVNWPNKTASLNTTHNYLKQDTGFTQTGDISLSIPLNTQHLVTTNYYYVQGEQRSNGNATLDFDSERFVKASFNQILGKSERGLDLASTDIEVENKHTPVGIKYIHEYDATGNTDVKQATVVHLYNATKFNVTGKIDVFTFATGKNLKLTAMHGERTLTFENEYESVDKELKQGSKVKWAEDVWINYNIHVTNMTTDETESQQIDLNIWYPLRRFNLLALYKLRDNLLEGSGRMNWNVKDENKTAELKAKWENPPTADANLHNVQLLLSHPSFRKDVSLNGYYISTPEVMSNISLELQYSDYENEYLRLKSILTDNSNGPIRDYRFGLTCSHPATNLDLEMRSDINIHSKWYYFDNYYRFQKSLFFQKLRQAKILIDMNNSTVMYARSNETYFYNMTGRWDLSYPDYTVSGTVARPTGGDTAHAVLSVKDRALTAHYNSTDDISYHLVGMIVDTRSAKLDAWRDYDDVTTVDLASYIRLNHSRLLTSSVVWRPQIFGEVKAYTVNTLKHVYSQVNETLVIIKEVPMEAHTALKNIWGDARVRVREFLDDLNDLHVIKDDFDEFDRFLNESYMKNDFYVKDIVEFTYYVLDEMAIRNHLESLPGIVNDMWGMMGNTSQSIKQSLTYVVDTIKKAYANFLDSLNKFLEADFMELVSDKLEAAIMQYDTFVRDLHMKLLDYWESTWVNARNRLSKYWHELLKSMEPLFFKVVHYTESFVFTLWRGVMDFFYSRTQELTDSPYFNYVSTFGHEMDRIYKDLVNEDIITNIKKYSKKLWNVAWDKIQKYIPFKDELGQLYAEFSNACDNFMHTPPVMYVREKCTEAYVRLKWWYDYFMIGEALDKTWDIIYAKITDFAKTALQYEEIHRTPKTNFVFDPRKGEILLEQKLPMSWHAFNRTPDFTEIAEYKAVKDFMDQWLTSNKSIWSYYYDIRPYMDFNNVLPPFGGTAMITAQGTLVTFDKRVLTVTQTGTFVLCKDYKHDKLTVLMEVHKDKPFTLLLLTKGKLLSINMATEQVSIDSGPPLTLPTTIGDYLVDRAGGVVSVWSEGARVSCSLQPRTCQLRVPGWYFASVGGLLGTYNNELYDDLQIPNKGITTNVTEAVRSWDIGPPGPREAITRVAQNETQCHKFFVNNVSPLHPCTQRINATPFFLSCVSGVDACSLAAAYLQLCEQTHAPVHIPEICATCTTPEGDTIEEGSFYKLDHMPASTDVVFVIEAQFCNKNLRKNKNIDLFIEAFDSKLQSNGLSDNRYAIVGFGGRGVYKKPRSLYVNNRVFTDATQIAQHFDNFVIEKQDQTRTNNSARADMFAALSAAATLPFRAGVPKTLILMPCTRCDIRFMRLDYSTIYHNLLENSITLHILMDEDFMLSKKRAAKYLFGVDSRLAYTNKDYENLVGDAGLRKQVKLPKDKLGLCMSLAMESNGTIFTARKLAGDRATARRLSTVLGGRVDPRAAPQRCECRETALHCVQQPAMELSFWDSEDIEELIDMAMEPPTLPLP